MNLLLLLFQIYLSTIYFYKKLHNIFRVLYHQNVDVR